jgi:chromosome segregation ATPase
LEALRTEIEQLVADVEQFSNQLTHKDKRVVEMRQRLSRLTDDIGELDKARKTESVQQEQLQEQVDALEEEYRKLLDLYIELEK